MSQAAIEAAERVLAKQAPNLLSLHRFVRERALPLWSAGGRDPGGAFLEQLGLDGTPDPAAPRRLRVQARQIYVYSHASLLGLTAANAIVRAAFARMIADYWVDEGFILSVDRHGRPVDSSCTAYDQAFALFAFAWFFRLTGDRSALEWAERTLRFLDRCLTRPGEPGYVDAISAPTRGQNPHMHLFEALLELYEASGERAYLTRADALFALFSERFFDRRLGVLREFFTAEWQPMPGGLADRLEPGHHFEWVWLLERYRRSRPGTGEEAKRLFAFATARGIDPADGLVRDQILPDGSVARGTKRLWPQTEHLKALLAQAQPGASAALEQTRLDRNRRAIREPANLLDKTKQSVFGHAEHALAEIERLCGLMLRHYLIAEHGTWNDQVGEHGERLSRASPASSFYHLFLAYAEAMRVVAGLDLPAGAKLPV